LFFKLSYRKNWSASAVPAALLLLLLLLMLLLLLLDEDAAEELRGAVRATATKCT
jgi:hypothetical protein